MGGLAHVGDAAQIIVTLASDEAVVAEFVPDLAECAACDGVVGVHVGGVNNRPVRQRQFNAAGRSGMLIDGERHDARVIYTEGRLTVHFDGEEQPSLVAPLNLAAAGAMDGNGRAWVGFTASTGITSIDADLLAFAFCQHPGCGAA